ncbi:MAG: hypothetical protein ACJ79A_15335 [Gemmatimonadaceae bacterium]
MTLFVGVAEARNFRVAGERLGGLARDGRRRNERRTHESRREGLADREGGELSTHR